MEYKYNELEYAEMIYKKGFQTKHIPTELRLLAIYMRDVLNMKPKERREKLYGYCEINIPNYNKAKYYKIINRALQQSTKKTNKLITIKDISIYEGEVSYINNIKLSNNHKKVLFSLLVHKKLSKMVYDIKNTDSKDKKEYNMLFFIGGKKIYNNLKKMSNVPESIRINDDIIHDLLEYKTKEDSEKYLITSLHKGLIVLNFINDIFIDDKNVISIKNFNNIGWYLDYYNGETDVKLCKCCNQPYKKTTNRQEYCCDDCKAQALYQQKLDWDRKNRNKSES